MGAVCKSSCHDTRMESQPLQVRNGGLSPSLKADQNPSCLLVAHRSTKVLPQCGRHYGQACYQPLRVDVMLAPLSWVVLWAHCQSAHDPARAETLRSVKSPASEAISQEEHSEQAQRAALPRNLLQEPAHSYTDRADREYPPSLGQSPGLWRWLNW